MMREAKTAALGFERWNGNLSGAACLTMVRSDRAGRAAMNPDPDPFEMGQRAARQNIPAEANPFQDGTEQHALWAAGHEQVAGAIEAGEAEDS